MKGFKKCFIVCLTLLGLFAPLFLTCSDTNALRSSVRGVQIRSIDYNLVKPSSTVTDEALISNTYKPIYNLQLYGTHVHNLSRLKLNFNNSVNVLEGDKFSYQFLIYTFLPNNNNSTYPILPSVQCPVAWSDYVFDNCSVTIIDTSSSLDSIREIQPQTYSRFLTDNTIITKTVVTIDGHWKGSNSSVSSFETRGVVLSIFNSLPSNSIYSDVYYSMSFPTFYFYQESNPDEEMNNKDTEDRDNLESQSSDTDSAADSSSEDAESTGTTLLGAFSAFVTALTSASPSNCVLDMDLGNLDLGNVDFCTLSPPQPIPTIASIFLILFCVPLSIATAKKVINLFRSFQ